MTFEQTSQIMEVLETAYPQFYNGKNAPDREKAIALWAKMFENDSAKLVSAAVYAIINTNASNFPPSIGAVKEKMFQLRTPEEMTEAEAWSLVQKALRNGYYGAKEEFAKLPPTVQRLVGSPSQLREWSMMDSDEVQTVVASNFQRSYRARAQSEREYEKLPDAVKEYTARLAQGMKKPELEAPKQEPARELPAPSTVEHSFDCPSEARGASVAGKMAERVKLLRQEIERATAGREKQEKTNKPDVITITEEKRREALARLMEVAPR